MGRREVEGKRGSERKEWVWEEGGGMREGEGVSRGRESGGGRKRGVGKRGMVKR